MNPLIDRIMVEYGLDFDNNRLGLGKSVEIEYVDGTEERVKRFKPTLSDKYYYFRIWIFKTVFFFSKKERFLTMKKNRNNFKIVFGIGGK